jgi:formylglycine-generating enzyme required for sulfatase activity
LLDSFEKQGYFCTHSHNDSWTTRLSIKIMARPGNKYRGRKLPTPTFRKSKLLLYGIALAYLCVIINLFPVPYTLSFDDKAHFIHTENFHSSQIPSPLPAIGFTNSRRSLKDGMLMLYVPAGDFMMGSEDGDSDEKPVHRVYLHSFWVDRTEITNGMYTECVSERVCTPPSSTSSASRDSYYNNPEYYNYPVSYVSWDHANTYCLWRENGSRLPTEAEWEKAARGTDQRIYPWGDSISCAFSNYGECVGDTTSVDSYELGQSTYGVYNLSGNVWEWVADRYFETYYQVSPLSNPAGPDFGEFRVLRGGSWLNYASSVTATNRNWYDPTTTSGNLGFRCVYTPFP